MPPPMENDSSRLLSSEENLQVFKLLGNHCQSLSTTVIQLYYTQPPDHSEWLKKGTGVLCFVKDNTKRSFFFRLFCLKRNTKLWEQEMYNNMDYTEAASFFHIFEGQDCIVAFNFASKEEAKNLKIIVNQKIQARRRREEKRTRQINHSQTVPGPTVDFAGSKKNPDPAAKLAKRKRNITKADISSPTDFKHVSHVGWNSTSGFDINTEDEELKAFFKKAGVSEQQLQDKSTREFLYDFVNNHGGRDAVVKGTSKVNLEVNTPPPAVPPRGPTRGPHFRNAPPPPIPVKSNNLSNHVTPRRPKPMEILPPKKPPPAPVPGPMAPAPPPPPPPLPMEVIERIPVKNTAPPPPPPSAADSGNSALLQSIRNGTTLKPVEERKITPEVPPQEDARGDLLSEIRKGCKLKPVEEREISTPPPKQGGDDIVSALTRALAERSRAIHSEDDDDNSEVSTDEEWED